MRHSSSAPGRTPRRTRSVACSGTRTVAGRLPPHLGRRGARRHHLADGGRKRRGGGGGAAPRRERTVAVEHPVALDVRAGRPAPALLVRVPGHCRARRPAGRSRTGPPVPGGDGLDRRDPLLAGRVVRTARHRRDQDTVAQGLDTYRRHRRALRRAVPRRALPRGGGLRDSSSPIAGSHGGSSPALAGFERGTANAASAPDVGRHRRRRRRSPGPPPGPGAAPADLPTARR